VATQLSRPDPERIKEAFLATGDAATMMAARTAWVDHLVLDKAERYLFPAVPSGVALLAVGGYGRRQLFPCSDIDLLLLFDETRHAEAKREAIALFLQQLWDSGLRVSQSVHTPAECAEVYDSNIELNISLLDQRYLAGDRALYSDLVSRLPKFIHANRAALLRNLGRLTRERHAKSAGTFFHLEPNVKETPGGLRDFQLVCWFSQIRETDFGRLAPASPDDTLQAAFRFLARLRCHLHYTFGRDANVLNFESQETSAAQAGTSEARLMREYYRHARTIYRAAIRLLDAQEAQASSLFSQFRDWRPRLSNADFSVARERVHFRTPQRLDHEPQLAFDLFRFVARHGIRPSPEAERHLEDRLPQLKAWLFEPRPLWPVLSEILSLPFAPLALRAMHEAGLLTAIFPELQGIECLVIRDFYHRYTVDEHTLVAVQNLCQLRDENEPPLRLYRDLLNELGNPAPLLLALLFHDAGKAVPTEDHIVVSLRLLDTAMARIQVPHAERGLVSFLVRRHPDLSIALQNRDIYDPQTLIDVAQQVETVERLKALTLVTYADIAAVNPTVMTPWRADQLGQLYLATYNELTRELESDRIDAILSGPPQRLEFLAGFPKRYLRTHSDAEIDTHAAMEERSRKRGVAVEIDHLEAAWRLTLLAADRPFLFAAVAGTLASFRLNILQAEAFANKRGLVLDSFTFADPGRNLELNPSEVDRLRNVLERVLLGKLDVKELLRARPVPAPPSRTARIEPRASFDDNAASVATLIEIVAEDRPGLLYDVSSAISSNGGNIEVVLIDTQAHKAIDVFYVTANGGKLPPELQDRLRQALQKSLRR